jgi:hypothetical protein
VSVEFQIPGAFDVAEPGAIGAIILGQGIKAWHDFLGGHFQVGVTLRGSPSDPSLARRLQANFLSFWICTKSTGEPQNLE